MKAKASPQPETISECNKPEDLASFLNVPVEALYFNSHSFAFWLLYILTMSIVKHTADSNQNLQGQIPEGSAISSTLGKCLQHGCSVLIENDEVKQVFPTNV